MVIFVLTVVIRSWLVIGVGCILAVMVHNISVMQQSADGCGFSQDYACFSPIIMLDAVV